MRARVRIAQNTRVIFVYSCRIYAQKNSFTHRYGKYLTFRVLSGYTSTALELGHKPRSPGYLAVCLLLHAAPRRLLSRRSLVVFLNAFRVMLVFLYPCFFGRQKIRPGGYSRSVRLPLP